MTVQAPAAAPHAGLARAGRAGAGLAGTGALTRLAFRRDRIMLPAWVYLITVLVATTAYYPQEAVPDRGRPSPARGDRQAATPRSGSSTAG